MPEPESTSEDSKVTVSVVIVTYNGRAYLPGLRKAIRAQVRSGDEVVVFDNGSSDETIQWVREEWPEARPVESPINLLFAAGNNAATRHAQGDVVLYLNQDALPLEGLLDSARRMTRPDQAVTYSQFLPWHNQAQLPYLDWSGVVLWRTPSQSVESVNMLSGAAFSLHRSTLDKIGGVPFDPRIPHICEDTNLSLRLEGMGIRLVGLRDASVRHDSTPSKGHPLRDFGRAILIARNRILAFAYAQGIAATLKRLPGLLLAGYRKARVDGQPTVTRVVGISLANCIGYMVALVKRPRPRG